MKTKRFINTNNVGWIIILFAIVLLYISYFLFYVPQQESLLRQRAFRILKEYGKNMDEKYDYFRDHLKNYALFYYLRPYYKHPNDNIKTEDKEILNVIDNLEPSIEVYDVKWDTGKVSSPQIIYDSVNYKYVLRFETPLNSVNLDRSRLKSGTLLYKFVTQYGDYFKDYTLVLDIPLSTLMRGLKFDGLLDNIILFDRTRVLHDETQVTVHDITNPEELADTVAEVQGGLFEKAGIRGEEKYMMIVPVNLVGKQYFLAGFIPAVEYNRKTRGIDNQLIIIISGILLLVLIGIPVLKVLFISRHERLNATDATNATISIIFGIGLLVLVVITILKHYLVDPVEMQHRLIKNSDIITHNFDADLDSVISLYLSIMDTTDGKNLLADSAREFFTGPKDRKFMQISNSILNGRFPVNEIILINDTGTISKAVTRTPFSDIVPIDLSQRLYYKNARYPEKSWPLKIRLNDIGRTVPLSGLINEDNDTTLKSGSVKFYLESIKSYNTGHQETAVSFPLNDSCEIARKNNAKVLAITSHIPSFYDQVLPEDISFVVINENGKVLFHSNGKKNLHENFLNECRQDPKLKGAMEHRVDQIMRLSYNEKNWLARAIPVKDAPLYYITLLDLVHNQNKNARIFLITFYFLIVTILCIIVGLQIMQRLHPGIRFIPNKIWSLSWLFFKSENYFVYKTLLFIQIILLICQVAGFFVIRKPVTQLVYQLIFISFSGIAAYTVLKEKKDPYWYFLRKANLDSTLMLILTIILVIILWKLQPDNVFILPVVALIVLSVLIHFIILIHSGRGRDELKMKRFLMNVFRHDEIKNSGTASGREKRHPTFIRNVYHAFMFLWLAGLTALPVLVYYRSVKVQEKELWHRNEREYVARQNLLLMDTLMTENKYNKVNMAPWTLLNLSDTGKNVYEIPWFRWIQGNGIDNLRIVTSADHFPSDHEDQKSSTPETEHPKALFHDKKRRVPVADSIYAMLPDPIIHDDNLTALLKNKSYQGEWRTNSTQLSFSKAGTDREVNVISNGYYRIPPWKWIRLLLIPILIATMFIWLLYRYLADNILNTIRAKWVVPEVGLWNTVVKDEQIRRIILNAFYGQNYLDETRNLLNQPGGMAKSGRSKSTKSNVKVLTAQDMLDSKYHFDESYFVKNSVIWITGLDNFIRQIETHEQIINKLIMLNSEVQGRIILVLPFEIEFVNELYEDYLAENETEKIEKARIYFLKLRWKSIFKDYFKYTARYVKYQDLAASELTVSKEKTLQNEDEHLFGLQNALEARYSYIWNNLCNLEKLVLYDLADDGMLNLKNKFLINRLVMKGLIIYKPYPRLFDESFQYFLRFSIRPEDAVNLEQKINRKGKWRSMRYLILLILVPLAGFVFISQGVSIEQVIGIFAGILALLSGLLRLFDSGVMKQSSA